MRSILFTCILQNQSIYNNVMVGKGFFLGVDDFSMRVFNEISQIFVDLDRNHLLDEVCDLDEILIEMMQATHESLHEFID